MARLNECILYRNFEHGEILDKMAELMNAWEQKAPDLKEKEGLFFEYIMQINRQGCMREKP